MNPNKGEVYFGRITASISHEINNVLAIVNELAGLQNDLLEGAEFGMEIDPQRFVKISNDIQTQIQRGERIVKRLNRFAHSMDETLSEFDLAIVVNDTIAIAQRLASLKGITLHLQSIENPITIMNNRFLVQQGIFAGLELMYTSNHGNKVEIECRQDNGKVEVYLTNNEWIPAEDWNDRLAALSEIITMVKGQIESIPSEENRLILLLTFPQSFPLESD